MPSMLLSRDLIPAKWNCRSLFKFLNESLKHRSKWGVPQYVGWPGATKSAALTEVGELMELAMELWEDREEEDLKLEDRDTDILETGDPSLDWLPWGKRTSSSASVCVVADVDSTTHVWDPAAWVATAVWVPVHAVVVLVCVSASLTLAGISSPGSVWVAASVTFPLSGSSLGLLKHSSSLTVEDSVSRCLTSAMPSAGASHSSSAFLGVLESLASRSRSRLPNVSSLDSGFWSTRWSNLLLILKLDRSLELMGFDCAYRIRNSRSKCSTTCPDRMTKLLLFNLPSVHVKLKGEKQTEAGKVEQS